MAIVSLISEDEKNQQKKETTITAGRGDIVSFRRTNAQLKKYREMKELEKNQEALARIQTDDFHDVLKRYYKNRPKMVEGSYVNFDEMSKKELLHYFYNDRTWRNNNTAALTRDVYDLGTGSEQDLSDWALIHQTYIDLLIFGTTQIELFSNGLKILFLPL